MWHRYPPGWGVLCPWELGLQGSDFHGLSYWAHFSWSFKCY